MSKGKWSSPSVTGERPPPLCGFSEEVGHVIASRD